MDVSPLADAWMDGWSLQLKLKLEKKNGRQIRPKSGSKLQKLAAVGAIGLQSGPSTDMATPAVVEGTDGFFSSRSTMPVRIDVPVNHSSCKEMPDILYSRVSFKKSLDFIAEDSYRLSARSERASARASDHLKSIQAKAALAAQVRAPSIPAPLPTNPRLTTLPCACVCVPVCCRVTAC